MTAALDPSRRTRVVIQSRLSSSRLPGKAMLAVAGMPLIELVARRAARSGHEVVVATSEEDYDEVITAAVRMAGIPAVRGSLDDVLGRFAMACEDLDGADLVVRLTGDNPLIDSALIDELVRATAAAGHRYGRVDIEAAPEGLGAEVFRVADLRTAAATAHDAYDREHVTPWLRRELGEHLHVPTGAPSDIHAYRATVDTLNDYVRVSRLFRDVPDPVAADWRDLIRGLGTAGRLGAVRAPRKDHSLSGSSAVALDCTGVALRNQGPPQERAYRAARLREILIAAVDHGVTDLVLDTGSPASVSAVRSASLPALAGRFAYLIRMSAGLFEDRAPAATVERTFALLGERRARALLLPAPSHTGWPLVDDYVRAGVIGMGGCTVANAVELDAALALSGIGIVELDLRAGDWSADPGLDTVLSSAASAGVRFLVRLGPGTSSAHSEILAQPWSAGVVVNADSVEELGLSLVAAG